MAITADYHLHSSHSGDSDAPMEHMIQSAISRGLTHMCFTEHMDLGYPVTPETPAGLFEVNTDAYRAELLRLREQYAPQIQIAFGIELGLQPGLAQRIRAYSVSCDFDFIIGSSHVAGGKDPYYPSFYEGRTEEEAYREYFQSIIDNIESFSNYDVYGHLDYVVRYGPNKDRDYSYAKYRDLFDKMLSLLLDQGKGIELNTAGIRKGMRDANPCMDVLKRYRQLGGELITTGSDAHRPEDVAADFARAEEILTACGFRYYAVFQNRRPEYRKIG
ncbi:MAG: histidinol-phosphatase HisJ family protein [Lachnospiraceae bacterium]|nr:histidinol-phosphatase HisJ family protein [Lachnospiraceae bacterium]